MITTCSGSQAETTGSLPPSDFTMQEYSLADVTNSDVDTQVVLDLVKGRTDLDGLSSREILSTFYVLSSNCSSRSGLQSRQAWTLSKHVLISVPIA